MTAPGSPDFELPEDDGEKLAWMKNFLTHLPELAGVLEIPPGTEGEMRQVYEQLLAVKEASDAQRLKRVELQLCRVPDAWPPPPTLLELMRNLKAIEEPIRTRMMKEIERWARGIELAKMLRLAPMLRGDFYKHGIVVRCMPLPEPLASVRMYMRQQGTVAWRFLCIVAQDYFLETDPAERTEDDEKFTGTLEFTAIGHLPAQDPMKADGYGAPSAILSIKVPEVYPPGTMNGGDGSRWPLTGRE